jgi:hypothetical protein
MNLAMRFFTAGKSSERQMPPETHLLSDMAGLVGKWEELGIDADDFLRCGACHKFIASLVEGTEPPLGADELCDCE